VVYPPCPNSLPGKAKPPFLATAREAELQQLEQHSRQAIRDALNRNSRKPFYWLSRRFANPELTKKTSKGGFVGEFEQKLRDNIFRVNPSSFQAAQF
jgi:hypothetical protein